MVKAPEKFLDEYLSHEKGSEGKTRAKSSVMPVRKISAEELERLKNNLQTLWDIYGNPGNQRNPCKGADNPFF